MHVKPEHITSSEAEMPSLQRGLNSSRNLRPEKVPKDALRTPEEFFRAAKAAGFNVVVTNFRDNQLARAVSSFEIKAGDFGSRSFTQRAHERFVDIDLSHSFRSLRDSYDRSVAAASAEGLVKLNLNFASVVSEQSGVFARWQGARGFDCIFAVARVVAILILSPLLSVCTRSLVSLFCSHVFTRCG